MFSAYSCLLRVALVLCLARACAAQSLNSTGGLMSLYTGSCASQLVASLAFADSVPFRDFSSGFFFVCACPAPQSAIVSVFAAGVNGSAASNAALASGACWDTGLRVGGAHLFVSVACNGGPGPDVAVPAPAPPPTGGWYEAVSDCSQAPASIGPMGSFVNGVCVNTGPTPYSLSFAASCLPGNAAQLTYFAQRDCDSATWTRTFPLVGVPYSLCADADDQWSMRLACNNGPALGYPDALWTLFVGSGFVNNLGTDQTFTPVLNGGLAYATDPLRGNVLGNFQAYGPSFAAIGGSAPPDSWTLAFWINSQAYCSAQSCAAFSDALSGLQNLIQFAFQANFGPDPRTNSDGQLNWAPAFSGPAWYASYDLIPGSWNHVAFAYSYSTASLRIFVNGEPVYAQSGAVLTPLPIGLGSQSPSVPLQLALFDDVRVFAVFFSSEQARLLYEDTLVLTGVTVDVGACQDSSACLVLPVWTAVSTECLAYTSAVYVGAYLGTPTYSYQLGVAAAGVDVLFFACAASASGNFGSAVQNPFGVAALAESVSTAFTANTFSATDCPSALFADQSFGASAYTGAGQLYVFAACSASPSQPGVAAYGVQTASGVVQLQGPFVGDQASWVIQGCPAGYAPRLVVPLNNLNVYLCSDGLLYGFAGAPVAVNGSFNTYSWFTWDPYNTYSVDFQFALSTTGAIDVFCGGANPDLQWCMAALNPCAAVAGAGAVVTALQAAAGAVLYFQCSAGGPASLYFTTLTEVVAGSQLGGWAAGQAVASTCTAFDGLMSFDVFSSQLAASCLLPEPSVFVVLLGSMASTQIADASVCATRFTQISLSTSSIVAVCNGTTLLLAQLATATIGGIASIYSGSCNASSIVSQIPFYSGGTYVDPFSGQSLQITCQDATDATVVVDGGVSYTLSAPSYASPDCGCCGPSPLNTAISVLCNGGSYTRGVFPSPLPISDTTGGVLSLYNGACADASLLSATPFASGAKFYAPEFDVYLVATCSSAFSASVAVYSPWLDSATAATSFAHLANAATSNCWTGGLPANGALDVVCNGGIGPNRLLATELSTPPTPPTGGLVFVYSGSCASPLLLSTTAFANGVPFFDYATGAFVAAICTTSTSVDVRLFQPRVNGALYTGSGAARACLSAGNTPQVSNAVISVACNGGSGADAQLVAPQTVAPTGGHLKFDYSCSGSIQWEADFANGVCVNQLATTSSFSATCYPNNVAEVNFFQNPWCQTADSQYVFDIVGIADSYCIPSGSSTSGFLVACNSGPVITLAPTTPHPTTLAPTTLAIAPTTHAATLGPTTAHPTTLASTTAVITQTTNAVTLAPTTGLPTTLAPTTVTMTQTTHATTLASTTTLPATLAPSTSTVTPTTPLPSTHTQTTPSPTTHTPTTLATTLAPTTAPTTPASSTRAPSTPAQTTLAPTTLTQTTLAATTLTFTTTTPSTLAATTASPTTPTFSATTPAASTSALTTPAPTSHLEPTTSISTTTTTLTTARASTAAATTAAYNATPSNGQDMHAYSPTSAPASSDTAVWIGVGIAAVATVFLAVAAVRELLRMRVGPSARPVGVASYAPLSRVITASSMTKVSPV